jgi:transcriptional regulator with XRE-family HTH domain
LKTIRELREARGWTQLRLAIELGVTPVTIYNWERGKYEPKVSQFRALAGIFGVSMDEIALGSPRPAARPHVADERQDIAVGVARGEGVSIEGTGTNPEP